MTRKTSGHVQYRHNFFFRLCSIRHWLRMRSPQVQRGDSHRDHLAQNLANTPDSHSRFIFTSIQASPSVPTPPTLCSKLPELPRTPRKASSCFSLPGNFLVLVLTFLALIFHEMSWVQTIILFSFVPDGWGFCLLLPQKLPRDTGKLASQAPGSTCPAMEAELEHKQGSAVTMQQHWENPHKSLSTLVIRSKEGRCNNVYPKEEKHTTMKRMSLEHAFPLHKS